MRKSLVDASRGDFRNLGNHDLLSSLDQMVETQVVDDGQEILDEAGLSTAMKRAAIGAMGLAGVTGGLINMDANQRRQEATRQAQERQAAITTQVAVRPPQPGLTLDAAKSKQAFIATMKNVVRIANKDIAETRQNIIRILRTKKPTLGQREYLEDMFMKYKVKNHDKAELLRRVQVIPSSLVLAQAALESGWGRSRLAQQGNAMFGQKTKAKFHIKAKDDGTGDLDGSSGSIRYSRFIDAEDSIAAYMRNLNTHPAYAEFRKARADMWKAGKKPGGLDLIQYLSNYSNERGEYIQKVSSMIKANKLDVNEAELLRGLPKTDKLKSPFVDDNHEWSAGHLNTFGYKKAGETDTHEYWKSLGDFYGEGFYDAEWLAINKETRRGDIHATGHQKLHKNGTKTFRVVNLAGRDGSGLKAHEFYSYIINRFNTIIQSSDKQSVGGMKVWKKLQNEPGIHVHGWDDGGETGSAVDVGKNSHITRKADDEHLKHPLDYRRARLTMVAHKDK